ncbi:MAG: hypothetical protein J1E41_08045, partial [Ruminococcus sp.]|nr:hypothetical protein [Ruminococcus sp.]
MKEKIRFTYLFFVLIFIFSLCTVNVFADDGDEPVATDPPPIVSEQPVPTETTPQTAATQATTKKITQATQATKATKATKATQPPKQTVATTPKSNNVVTPTQATRSTYVAATKANTSPVYNVEDENIATDTLKKKDWSS